MQENKSKKSGTGSKKPVKKPAKKPASGKRPSSSGKAKGRKPAAGRYASEKRKNRLGRALLLVLPWCGAALLYTAAEYAEGFANWYALHIYPLFEKTIGRLMNLVSFSVLELLAYGLIAAAIISLIIGIGRIRAGRRSFKRALGRALYRIFTLAGFAAMIFMLFGGVNYKRDTFAESYGLEVKTPDRSQLEDFLYMCVEEINAVADEVERDGWGRCEAPKDAAEIAVSAMKTLGEEVELLSGYYPRPKLIWWTDFLSYQQVTGMYSPFTIEATVNGAQPGYELPSSMCHELSHLKGFMREDEANFLAFLACIGSESPEFRYSGWLVAFIYAGNDLAKYDYERYVEIRELLKESVKTDMSYGSSFWARFDGPVSEAQSKANDTYLKLNGQEAGVESYNQVVRLMISWFDK